MNISSFPIPRTRLMRSLHRRVAFILRRGAIFSHFQKLHPHKGGIKLVVPDRKSGFFAFVLAALGAAAICQKMRWKLELCFDSGPYLSPDKGPNWWNYYFVHNTLDFTSGSDTKAIALDSKNDLNQLILLGRSLPFNAGKKLLDCFGLKGSIQSEIDMTAEQLGLRRSNTVGIHYRGTDKVDGASREAQRVSYHNFGSFIQEKFSTGFQFFIATDEQNFLSWAKDNLPGEILWCPHIARSSSGKSLHLDSKDIDPFENGKGAILDCWLLAKCHYLARTESNLSLVASFVNPNIPVLNLTQRLKRR